MCPLGEGRISKVNHKLSPEDMRKLYASDTFSLVNPKSLQRKVFFDVMFYLCRRGRENHRTVKKSDFSLKVDEKGDYIEKVNKSMKFCQMFFFFFFGFICYGKLFFL